MTDARTSAPPASAPQRTGVAGAASKAIDTASHAIDATRARAERTLTNAGESPLALIAGGVALGVLIGVLLPRFEREREALRPLGKRLAEGATAAATAAKETGKAELESLLPTADAAKEHANKLIGNVVEAVKGTVPAA